MSTLPNWLEYVLSKSFTQKYVTAAVIDAAGVPILAPRIVNDMWEIWQPMTQTYTQTGVVAVGQDGVTPHIDVGTGNWFIGTTDTGVKATGQNGREIELRENGTYLQWRYVGDASWQNLFDMSVLLADYYNKTEVDSLLDEKLDIDQGVTNAGQFLVVGDDGLVVPQSVDFSIEYFLTSQLLDPVIGNTNTIPLSTLSPATPLPVRNDIISDSEGTQSRVVSVTATDVVTKTISRQRIVAPISSYALNTLYLQNFFVKHGSMLYMIPADFTSSNDTGLTIDENLQLDIDAGNLVAISVEPVIVPPVIDYAQGVDIKAGFIVRYGNRLFVALEDFTTDDTMPTIAESLAEDIDSGFLLAVGGEGSNIVFDEKTNFPATGDSSTLYVDTSTETLWRWNGTTYVPVGGTNSSTLFKKEEFTYMGTNSFTLQYPSVFEWWVKVVNADGWDFVDYTTSGDLLVVNHTLSVGDKVRICYAVSNPNIVIDVIDDSQISLTTTWSSYHINNLLEAIESGTMPVIDYEQGIKDIPKGHLVRFGDRLFLVLQTFSSDDTMPTVEESLELDVENGFLLPVGGSGAVVSVNNVLPDNNGNVQIIETISESELDDFIDGTETMISGVLYAVV